MFSYLFVICISVWFALSAFVDFVAIPTVFRNITSLKEAGQIGMIVFSAFNNLEVVLGLACLIFGWNLFPAFKRISLAFWRATLVGLVLLSCLYRFHMTPTITQLTHDMHQHELESEGYKEVQKVHGAYHRAYVKMDGAKLLVLVVMLGTCFVQFRRKQCFNKDSK